jgi:hypothetical protein
MSIVGPPIKVSFTVELFIRMLVLGGSVPALIFELDIVAFLRRIYAFRAQEIARLALIH